MGTDDDAHYITLTQISLLHGIPLGTLRGWRQKRCMPRPARGHAYGNVLLWDRDEVEKWVAGLDYKPRNRRED